RPAEPGWRVGRSLRQAAVGIKDLTRKGLSLVTFFGPAKKVTRGRRKLLVPANQLYRVERVKNRGAELSPEGESLSLQAKESNQRKAFPERAADPQLGGTVIFRLGILPRSENSGHPCPLPCGFARHTAA
ncbi:MAG: hypothetical protein M3Q40_00950, partial [Pseudomonadota bacterium]|nr:hypothetical protein [Pseudomonadota bacterium]